ncbi:MAG TPA: ABC transporter permease [Candidatus Faecaligallichristensenella faecipullorum]|nr:ABC transporter permease [Candidatus Faecaligallichristensenella faecipullorum]
MEMDQLVQLILNGTGETLYMTLISTAIAYVIGLPLGVLLVITEKGHIRPNPYFNSVLGTVINLLRSIPFLILIVMLFPVTRAVMGSAIGSKATILPLVVGAFPYIARMVESSLKEVDHGVIEAAQSMGASPLQIIYKVMLPESFPSLLNGLAICLTTILGYTAMAGAVGGGGLGKIAIDYGLNRNKMDILYVASIALVLLVQVMQVLGTRSSKWIDHRRK